MFGNASSLLFFPLNDLEESKRHDPWAIYYANGLDEDDVEELRRDMWYL